MNKEEYFDYLDGIRDSGIVNMFGAGPYLQDAFGLSRYEARDILLEWMNTFAERQRAKSEIS